MESKKVKVKFYGSEFTCEQCNKTFQSERILSFHMRVMHKQDENIQESQKVQDLDSKSKNATSRLYKCGICDKSFTTKKFLNRHNFDHKGEIPFMCEHCGASFSSKISLDTHDFVHCKAKEKPYECEYCGVRLTCESILMLHKKTYHEPNTSNSETEPNANIKPEKRKNETFDDKTTKRAKKL